MEDHIRKHREQLQANIHGSYNLQKSEIDYTQRIADLKERQGYSEKEKEEEDLEKSESPGELERNRISDNIQKSFSEDQTTPISDILEKGGKRAQNGEVRMWGKDKWVKHEEGWVNVSKTGKATLERPGGKREAAGEHHVAHHNTHIERHGREGGVHDKGKSLGGYEGGQGSGLDLSKEERERFDAHEKRGFDPSKGDEDVTGKEEKIPDESSQNNSVDQSKVKVVDGVAKYPMASGEYYDANHFAMLVTNGKKHLSSSSKELENTKQKKIDENSAIRDLLRKVDRNKKEDKSIFESSEGSFTNNDSEKLNYRVYKDGGVRITGSNLSKEFKTAQEATDYVNRVGFNKPDHIDVKRSN